MAGRRLNDLEIEAYDVVATDLARRVKVYQVPLIPGGYAGMTLGRAVLLARDVETDGDSVLLAHELVHVQQWTDRGLFGFSRWYLGSFLRNLAEERNWQAAYQKVEAEIEARDETRNWLRRRSGDHSDS